MTVRVVIEGYSDSRGIFEGEDVDAFNHIVNDSAARGRTQGLITLWWRSRIDLNDCFLPEGASVLGH